LRYGEVGCSIVTYLNFIREAIFLHKNNRHKHKFREILETLAGEILILSKWEEKGHPGGAKWTEKEEQQLEYYERCFSILENSPFNDKIYIKSITFFILIEKGNNEGLQPCTPGVKDFAIFLFNI